MRPDLVHVIHDEMSEAALILSESSQLPYIQTVADFRTLGRGLRLSRRWCRQVVAIRPELADGLVSELGVPELRVTVIAPGIALPEEPTREPAAGRVPVIGTGGPLDDVTGLVVFLEAARRVLESGVDAEFVIAGQGASHVELRRRAQDLGIAERVTVAEFPSVGADYWAVLDIYCQPSIAPNSGVTLLQAMAHAVPCIATAAAGLRGLIEPGSSGLTIPPDDPAALEAAIIELLDRPEEARRLGRNAPPPRPELLRSRCRGRPASGTVSRCAGVNRQSRIIPVLTASLGRRSTSRNRILSDSTFIVSGKSQSLVAHSKPDSP